MKINKAIENYLKYILITNAEATYSYENGKCNTLKKYFQNMECEDITKHTIIDFIAQYKMDKPKITNNTINKSIAVLNRVLCFNIDKRIDFKKLKERNKLIPTVPKEIRNEIHAYFSRNLNRYTNYRNYLFFKVLEETGLRLTEALNIRIANIEFDRNTIYCETTKTKNDRVVFLTENTKTLLIEYIMKFSIIDYIFLNEQRNEMWNSNSVMTVCRRLKKKLKLAVSITPHKWRHTFATNFLKNGVDIESLRLILGHTKLSTTQKYLHLDQDYLKRQFDKVQRHMDSSEA